MNFGASWMRYSEGGTIGGGAQSGDAFVFDRFESDNNMARISIISISGGDSDCDFDITVTQNPASVEVREEYVPELYINGVDQHYHYGDRTVEFGDPPTYAAANVRIAKYIYYNDVLQSTEVVLKQSTEVVANKAIMVKSDSDWLHFNFHPNNNLRWFAILADDYLTAQSMDDRIGKITITPTGDYASDKSIVITVTQHPVKGTVNITLTTGPVKNADGTMNKCDNVILTVNSDKELPAMFGTDAKLVTATVQMHLRSIPDITRPYDTRSADIPLSMMSKQWQYTYNRGYTFFVDLTDSSSTSYITKITPDKYVDTSTGTTYNFINGSPKP